MITYTVRQNVKAIFKADRCIFLKKYNESSKDVIPVNITHLMFDTNFNNNVYKLPSKLVCVRFNTYFNNNINYLPNSIKELYLEERFNRQISKLPMSLEIFQINNINYKYIIPIPSEFFMLNNKQQVKQLISSFPDVVNIIPLKKYNEMLEQKLNIKEIWIYKKVDKYIDSRVHHLIKYINNKK